MTEIVWVALISSGSAILVALMTQFLAMRAADIQASHRARQEEVLWQRTEAKALRELHDARLRELWSFALQAQNRVRDMLDMHVESLPQSNRPQPIPEAALSATSAAGQAYAVALTGLPEVRPQAKAFYKRTAEVEYQLRYHKQPDGNAVLAWRKSFDELEEVMISASNQAHGARAAIVEADSAINK